MIMNKFIPLSIPNFEGNEKEYVDEAIKQGWVSTGGAYITELEKNLARYIGAEDVVACQSGTAAIHLALIEAGVNPGDMVIVPTLTFIAAVNPVKYQFASPIFMDCDDSLCMDPVKLRAFCREECEVREVREADGKQSLGLFYKNSGKHIKAIVVVHVFGNMADMEAIMDIAKENHLKVIEDATEALGTYYTEGCYKGRYAGTIGDYGAYSFNGNKIITTGGGGAVTAKCVDDAEHMRYLSTQAKNDPHYYIHDEVGYNYRMTNVQAALGVAQLEELPDFIVRKQSNYEYYSRLLSDLKNAGLIKFREGTYSNMWFYSLQIDLTSSQIELRDIISNLQNKGIQTRAIWGLIHEQEPYKKDVCYKIEKANFYKNVILNIPCSTQITRDEIEYVVEKIKNIIWELS